jgi:type I restriction enzyme M protein
MNDWPQYADFIWSVADLLRGDYKQSEYGRVILPFVVLRRLDCVLEPTKPAVLEVAAKNQGMAELGLDLLLRRAADEAFYNTSKLMFPGLLDDANNVAANLRAYIGGFSAGAAEVLDKFAFDEQIARLDQASLLYLIVAKFADIDLHPRVLSNLQMGYVFEELIRRFSEQSNETAGEHFTPRQVIHLMVSLLFAADDQPLRQAGAVRTLYDPACGTGGMLSVAEDHLRTLNPKARLEVFGQELNDESYAICRSDMMLKGQDPSRIAVGNTLSNDAFVDQRFDYMLSNPPFGVEWKKVKVEVEQEAASLGHRGRFGAGLPSITDGSLLFLQHMAAKMKPADEGGSRIAIVFNSSPLFKGAPESGESEIRRWLLENDWVEAIVALPDQLFYNTGIATYIWVVTNHKAETRRGRVQLIDARSLWERMPKSLGQKRKELSDEHIAEVTRAFVAFTEGDRSRIIRDEAFGYLRVVVEQPLRASYEVPADVAAMLRETTAFIKLAAPPKNSKDPAAAMAAGEAAQALLSARLDALVGFSTGARADMDAQFSRVWDGLGIRPPKALKDAVWRIVTIRDPDGETVLDGKGRPVADVDARDYEQIPLTELVADYLARAVLPEVPDAWVDEKKTKLGYSIPLTRYFYRPEPATPIAELDARLREVNAAVMSLLAVASQQVDDIVDTSTTMERKPSTIPWLDTVPAHWDEVKLSRVARLGSGHTPSRKVAEYWENCTIPWITTGEVAQVRDDRQEYIYETRERISEFGLENSAAVLHPADTVVLCRTASAGYSAIMGTAMATSQDFVTWTCSPRLRPRFLLLCLRAMRGDLLGRLAMGSTHQTIYVPDIESLRIPLPPVDEQDAIVEAVASRAAAIDELVDQSNLQLELLAERRRALLASGADGALLAAIFPALA